MLINFIFIVAIGALSLLLMSQVQQQRRQRPTPRRRSRPQPVPVSRLPEDAIRAVATYTHDRDTAERLLLGCGQMHGNRGWEWVVDRVIQDLIRDRR